MTTSVQHWLLYGDAGAGKSTSAATFPKPALVFLFDPLGKDTPYLRRGDVTEEKGADGTLVRTVTHRTTGNLLFRIEHYLDSDPQNPTAYSRFLKRLTTLERDIEALGIQTVIVDSVTFMELMARKNSQYVLNKTSREPRQWYAASTESLEEILMIRFGTLPINVVVLAHISDEKISSSGVNVFSIAAPGRLARRGPAAYSEVYRAYTVTDDEGNREYLWQTRPNALYAASTQIEAPDPCIADYRMLWAANG